MDKRARMAGPTVQIMTLTGRELRAPFEISADQAVPRPMELLTEEQRDKLLENGRATARSNGAGVDHAPVVKLFTPDASATWLLSELDPDEPDQAFGLCDLGLGFPELGYASIAEISEIRGSMGLPVERDLSFRPDPDKPLTIYADEARRHGRIVVEEGQGNNND